MWSGGRLTKIQATTRPENFLLKFGPKLEKPIKREKSKSGQTRNQSSIMLEGCEAFISSMRKMVNMKKPSKTQGESWKFQCWRRCLPKTEQRTAPVFRKLKRRAVNPTRFQKKKKNKACMHRGGS